MIVGRRSKTELVGFFVWGEEKLLLRLDCNTYYYDAQDIICRVAFSTHVAKG
jgi:hypothetical protein